MKRSHVVIVLVLFILSVIVNFSYAEENAIRIGGVYVKIGMSLDELRRILPAKYTLIDLNEAAKKGVIDKRLTHVIYHPGGITAEVYTVKNIIVSIGRHVGEYGGGEILELGDAIYSTIAAALENKSSDMALVGVKTVRVSKDPTISVSADIVTVTIGKRAIVISVERGMLMDTKIGGVSVMEMLGPVDLVDELLQVLQEQPRYRILEKRK